MKILYLHVALPGESIRIFKQDFKGSDVLIKRYNYDDHTKIWDLRRSIYKSSSYANRHWHEIKLAYGRRLVDKHSILALVIKGLKIDESCYNLHMLGQSSTDLEFYKSLVAALNDSRCLQP